MTNWERNIKIADRAADYTIRSYSSYTSNIYGLEFQDIKAQARLILVEIVQTLPEQHKDNDKYIFVAIQNQLKTFLQKQGGSWKKEQRYITSTPQVSLKHVRSLIKGHLEGEKVPVEFKEAWDALKPEQKEKMQQFHNQKELTASQRTQEHRIATRLLDNLS